MAIFSVSDIIIATTLVVNALALTSSKFRKLNYQHDSTEKCDDERKLHHNPAYSMIFAENGVTSPQQSHGNDFKEGAVDDSSDYIGASVMVRIRMLVYGMRKFSCVIVVWNVFFFVLMVFVFGS